MPTMAASLERYPARITSAWFLSVILIGGMLLSTPWASADLNNRVSIVDAFFTSTSAACVTGLIVRSTPDDFSWFGQIVILILFQIGGIGIMTLTTAVLQATGVQGGLRNRAVLATSLGIQEHEQVNVRKILRRILWLTFLVEVIGIALLWIRFLFEYPWATALWYAIFHGISAFCNAGFALYDDSLVRYQGDLYVNLVICSLVIIGGIGFPVMIDLWNCSNWKTGIAWSSLHLHSKFTLIGSAFLLVFGFLAVLILEWETSLAPLPLENRILVAFFNSCASRTAGFNTIDLNEFSNASLFLTMILMAIGGGTCSTAGGIKVSTVSLLVFHAYRRFHGRSMLSVFRRTIPQSAVDRAMATTMAFLGVGIVACTVFMVAEQAGASHGSGEHLFLDAMFEVVSSLGTVGLSVGLTSGLSFPGKLVIIALMFIGRLGPLSVAATLSRTIREPKVEFSHEEPLVG